MTIVFVFSSVLGSAIGGAGAAIKAARAGANVADTAMDVKSAGNVAEAASDAGSAGRGAKQVEAPCAINCFVAGTLVAVFDGTEEIQEVEVGDQVLAYDPAAEGDWVMLDEEPAPDPTACDPETDPDCRRRRVPIEVDARVEVRHD